MPSLPPLSSAPTMLMETSRTSKAEKYREAAYHQDSQGRYVAQSYEVRPPPRPSPPATTPYRQRPQQPQSTEYSCRTQSNVRTELSSFKMTSKKSVVIVQAREGLHDDVPGVKPQDAEPSQSVAPPPAPRPHRLSTPELSDIEDDRPFCDCDFTKDVK